MMAQWERICLPTQVMWVKPLGQKDPLEKEISTHFSIRIWEDHRQRSLSGYSS